MPRIPLVSAAELTPDQKPVFDAIVSAANRKGHLPAPYQLSLHCPELTDKWQQIGELLRYRTSLPRALNELAILVTARHWACQYEWFAHAPPALDAGLPAYVVEAIRQGERPEPMSIEEQAVYEYCKDLLSTHFVRAEKHAAVTRILGVNGVVELTALVGYYVMVAMALNAHEYPLPPGAENLLPQLPHHG
jgi:4-carboxymuconolactone decarboxylase